MSAVEENLSAQNEEEVQEAADEAGGESAASKKKKNKKKNKNKAKGECPSTTCLPVDIRSINALPEWTPCPMDAHQFPLTHSPTTHPANLLNLP